MSSSSRTSPDSPAATPVGLVELEDLRDAGVRIISIGDGIDFPNDDDWLKIQFQFLINEMPVTDTSKKVQVCYPAAAGGRRDGFAPRPTAISSTSRRQFEIVPTEAEIVRQIFRPLQRPGLGLQERSPTT